MSSEKDKEKYIKIPLHWWTVLLAVITVVVIIPSLVAFLITVDIIPITRQAAADANSWLQFWGSMLGGIIGTAAVLIVAAWQNKEQRRLLEMQLEEQKNENNITRELEYNKVKREELYNYLKELEDVSSDSKEYTNNMKLLINHFKYKTVIPTNLITTLNNQIEIMSENYERIHLLYSTIGFKEGHDLGGIKKLNLDKLRNLESEEEYESIKLEYNENHLKLFNHIQYVRKHIREMNNFNL